MDVLETIKKYKMLNIGDAVIIGLSGGADSVCLTHLLAELAPSYSLTLYAVHVNHGLRGEEALKDETFALDLCKNLNIECEIVKRDVPLEAKKSGASFEEAARRVRYDAFNKAAARFKRGYVKIAVGHNKNDVAETVLFNIARGSGLQGACGIPPLRDNIIRPLAETAREEIEAYLTANNIAYVTDSTNQTLDYARNIIRHKVTAALNSVNGQAVNNIVNFSELAREDNEYLNQIACDAYNNCSIQNACGEQGLDINKINALAPAIKRRVIRLFFKNHGALQNLSREHTDNIIRLCINAENWRFSVNKFDIAGSFGILNACIKTTGVFSYAILPDTPVFVKELNALATLSFTKNIGVPINVHKNALEGLTIRSRRAGDKIFFSSVGGHKLIKSFLTEKKVPAHLRDGVPLIAFNNNVYWLRLGNTDIFAQPPPLETDNYTRMYLFLNFL